MLSKHTKSRDIKTVPCRKSRTSISGVLASESDVVAASFDLPASDFFRKPTENLKMFCN